MEKVIEFSIEDEQLKKYLEDCLIEERINYEIKLEGRWKDNHKQASQYYEVYCLYVNDNFDKVNNIIKEFKDATIIVDDIEELKNVEEEEDDRFKIFSIKNFLKFYWLAIIIIAVLIILGAKFTN